MKRALGLASLILVGVPLVALAAGDTSAVKDAFTKANQNMMTSMHSMPPTGDADKDFVMMMMPHHQGAIDMAKIELQYGKDKELRAMADKIIKAQEKEISEMKNWQAAHP
jgi:uncharacterized protein (DUF305 family)